MIRKTFWFLIGTFVLVLCQFFVPPIQEVLRGPLLFLLPFIIFSLTGGALIFFTLKKKIKGILKKFLLITGVSASGFFVSVLLHNFLYALGILTEHIFGLNQLFELLNVVFFLIAVIACPIGFIIGAIGSIMLFRREKSIK